MPPAIGLSSQLLCLRNQLTVAVGAFRVVVELDMKRRDNDKKIGVLFVEMRDMMEALLQCVLLSYVLTNIAAC